MREKTFANIIGEKYDFRRENFRRLFTFAMPKDATPPNFAEKTFENSHKSAKFAKVFFLESFLLYGIWYPSLGVILMVATIHSSDDVLLQVVTYFECMNPVIAHVI